MLKNELIKIVSKESGVASEQVRLVMEQINKHTIEAVQRGEEVMLLGLGKISVTNRGPKQARNIHTGESVIVPPRRVPIFRPSVSLTKAAQGSSQE